MYVKLKKLRIVDSQQHLITPCTRDAVPLHYAIPGSSISQFRNGTTECHETSPSMSPSRVIYIGIVMRYFRRVRIVENLHITDVARCPKKCATEKNAVSDYHTKLDD